MQKCFTPIRRTNNWNDFRIKISSNSVVALVIQIQCKMCHCAIFLSTQERQLVALAIAM